MAEAVSVEADDDDREGSWGGCKQVAEPNY